MFAPQDYLDLNHNEHRMLFENAVHAWDALKQIPSYLQFRLKPGIHGKLIGRHRSTGIGRPKFWDRARYYGDEKRLAAALDAAEIQGEPIKG